MNQYRILEKGEIIQAGDEVDVANSWRDAPNWQPAQRIGGPAPDPAYLGHRIYRRRASETGGEKSAMKTEQEIRERLQDHLGAFHDPNLDPDVCDRNELWAQILELRWVLGEPERGEAR